MAKKTTFFRFWNPFVKTKSQHSGTKHPHLHYNFHPEGENGQRVLYFRIVRMFDDDLIFLNSNLTLPLLAEMLGTNTSYITRVIQYYSDSKGFCDFLNKRRVLYAETLLLSNNHLNIATIASKSGYNSASAFNQNFRKYEKMSPGVWRKTHSAASTALK